MTLPWEQPDEGTEDAEIEELVAECMGDQLAQAFDSELGFDETAPATAHVKEDAALVLLARIAVELAVIRTLLMDELDDRDDKPWEGS